MLISERFFTKVSREDTIACWDWTGAINSAGYGSMLVGSRSDGSRTTMLSHRISWEIHHGPILDGLHVLHHCDRRQCVNPDHLFLGTNKDNMADRDAKGRCRAGVRNSEKTHCPRGHAYDQYNTRVYSGHRACIACCQARDAAKTSSRRGK
jgi:hypothetical protein